MDAYSNYIYILRTSLLEDEKNAVVIRIMPNLTKYILKRYVINNRFCWCFNGEMFLYWVKIICIAWKSVHLK